jgi:predicted GNAT family acetyltransferase
MKPINHVHAAEGPDGMSLPGIGVTEGGSELAGNSTTLSAPSADADIEFVIHDVAELHEYRALLGDRTVGHIVYRTPRDKVVVLEKTFMDPELRGQGIGTAFIAHVLDERMARGDLIIVECTMIRQFVETHHDYVDVIVTDG